MKALKIHNGKGKAETSDIIPAPWSNFFSNPLSGLLPSLNRNPYLKAPAVDISEDGKELIVKAEVPGLSEKDLDLSYLDGVLYLKGEKKEEKESKDKHTWYRESWQGSFTRGVPVGRNVDWRKAQAKYKDGVLTVTIPKQPGSGESRVKINIQ